MRSDRQILDRNTSEDRISEWIDEIERSIGDRDLLLELLLERSDIYKDRSTNETIRIRGYILSKFEHLGLPDSAIPYVLEELESGRDAYLVAAAAKAVRGMANPSIQLIPFLFKAVENVKYIDDAVTFDSYKPQWPTNYTTALTEIFKTFQWLGKLAESALIQLEDLHRDCQSFSVRNRTKIQETIDSIRASNQNIAKKSCCDRSIDLYPLVISTDRETKNTIVLSDIELEDQDGKRIKYDDFFVGMPSIVVFFYSRCNNPHKCSLTITKLAQLQQAISNHGLEQQLKTVAITYDPQYDVPTRLKAYGENRGIVFNERNRMFRTIDRFQELQDFFQLGVNFNHSIVNRHRIELFILDGRGEIITTFARLQWNIDRVIDSVKELLDG
jgi:protein SCO1